MTASMLKPVIVPGSRGVAVTWTNPRMLFRGAPTDGGGR